MRLFIRSAVFMGILCTLAMGCSNDFLQENLSPDSYPAGTSNIYLSPNWPIANYQFTLPSIKEGEYEIVSKPSWLKTASDNGHIADSIGVITCSAVQKPDYDMIGVYIESLTVKANGKIFKLPIAYINEGYPKVQVESNVSLTVYGSPNPYFPITNDGPGILIWGIKSMPDWLEIDTPQVDPNDFYIRSSSTINVPLKIKLDTLLSENMTGTVVLSTNDKEHPSLSIQVSANLGTPQVSLDPKPIDFSFTENDKEFGLFNYGDGYLVWEFSNLPDWLSITPSHGMFNPYANHTITFHCDRKKLSPGKNSTTIQLKSNGGIAPIITLKVSANAPGSLSTVRAVEGNIVEATFNKNTNTLYYITSSPNKLVSFDVIEKKVIKEIELSKTPTCFAISEDWTTSAVGHNEMISVIDLSTNTLTKTHTTNYMANTIAWAKDNWFSYTQLTSGWGSSNLHWINTADGTKNEYTLSELDYASIVKKVPNQPYQFAIRTRTSPTGFITYDIGTMSKKSYSHKDISKFWFSENGDYVYTSSLEVFLTANSTESTNTFNAPMNRVAMINPGPGNEYPIIALYHSNHNLWLILNDYKSGNIYQIEDKQYSLVKTYAYDSYYQPNAQATPLIISPRYVYINGEGTELSVLQKSENSDAWIIQFIPVK